MKTRIPALLLCLAMLTALVPTGILSIPAAAAPDNNFCKTENVEVPAGWDYVEVSNAEELLATEERHGGWDSDGKSMFVRLTADIRLSAGNVGQYERACLQLVYWTSTIIDFNGHTIKCYINAEKNGDNRTWYGVYIFMNYGLVPDQYLRLVDSAGGGGITLDARTDVDGPTNALWIEGQSMKRYAPAGYQANYTETRPTVYIDGGYYGMTTYNNKFCGVQGEPLNDSNGYPRWTNMYTRSAVGLYYCSAVINNGHFCAEYDKDASGVSADMGKRFLSDFGYLNLDHLAINGGLFNGTCYSVMTYETLSCYYDGVIFKQMIPVINGGEFHGGIQLCTTRTSYWRKLRGCYDLNPKMKDIKVSEALYPGAKMYMDGKLIDPDEKDLEDIAWPHLITVRPGPHIIKTKLLDENLATGCYTGYYVQYNKMPDSAILQEYITVIRLGQEQSYWTEAEGSYYTLQTNLGENYLNFFVPAKDTAGTRRYRVRATFGDITILSDEFEVYWIDFSDFKFTVGPDWHDGGGSGVAYVDFDFYRYAMWHYKLYWLVHGDHWQSIDDAPYLTPQKNNDLYRFYLPKIEENDSDSTTYCIIVTYKLNGVVYNIYSDEFTLAKADLGDPMDPDGVALDCTECILGIGESKTVKVTLFPTSAPHKEGFTVKSSDPGVAQASAADGCFTIKANKAGTATITVTAEGGASAECAVTVIDFDKHADTDTDTDTDTDPGTGTDPDTDAGADTDTGTDPVASFLPGDVNGDGAVDNKDVVTLFRYLSGTNVTVNTAALDINGDGEADNKDVVFLFRYLSGANVTLSDKPYIPKK